MTISIVVPPSRYRVTLRIDGELLDVEYDGLDTFCPVDLPLVHTLRDDAPPNDGSRA